MLKVFLYKKNIFEFDNLVCRKYDEIISINDIPVTETDQNLVRSLLDGATSNIKLVRTLVYSSFTLLWHRCTI